MISTLPVWNVLRVVPESALPDWYTAQIRFLAQDHLRISWLGLYLATKEPVHAIDARELGDLAAHAQGARERLLVQHDRDGPEHVAAGDQPLRRGRDHPRVQGARTSAT